MPTYFGPTNIPPLEAFLLKVPVIYSGIIGLKEFVPNSGAMGVIHIHHLIEAGIK